MKRIFPALPGKLLMLLAVLAALLRCDDGRVSGTSVGTDNPEILALAITRNGEPARMTGRIELYSDRHNPLIDSAPLAVFAATGRDTFRLSGDSLLARLLPSGLVRPGHDTTFSVNVLGQSAEGDGGFLGGLTFAYREGGILFSQETGLRRLPLAPLGDYRGAMVVSEKESITNYVAIFGTPYFASIRNGAFILKSMVPGRYALHWIPFDRSVPVTGSEGLTAPVYGVDTLLDTGVEGVFIPGAFEDTVAFPKTGPRPAG